LEEKKNRNSFGIEQEDSMFREGGRLIAAFEQAGDVAECLNEQS
jgi:hypothetical protein